MGDFLLDILDFVVKGILILFFIFMVVAIVGNAVSEKANGAGDKAKGRFVIIDLKKQSRERHKMMKKALKRSHPNSILKKLALEVGVKRERLDKTNEELRADIKKKLEQQKAEAAKAAAAETAEAQATTNTVASATTASAATATVAAPAAATDAATAAAAVAGEAQTDVKTEAQTDAKAKTKANAKSEAKVEGKATVETMSKAGCLVDKLKHKVKDTPLVSQRKGTRAKLEQKMYEQAEFAVHIEDLRSQGQFCPENLYVVDFKGSTRGSEVRDLRRNINAILEMATDKDEVIVNISSPGGLVNSYGLCASQLQRLRDRNIFVTVTVDEVAASGGYLMACVANKIVAAPFSYIGSIGVIAGIPNFRRVMNKYNVDYEQVTAGKYKRTLSVSGENTDEGRAKFKEELEAVHQRFKEQVLRYRPNLDIERIATGEHWLAVDAKELGLVDEIATSDEYIASRMAVTEFSALQIKWQKTPKKNLLNKYLPVSKLFAGRKGGALAAVHDAAQDDLDELETSSYLRLK